MERFVRFEVRVGLDVIAQIDGKMPKVVERPCPQGRWSIGAGRQCPVQPYAPLTWVSPHQPEPPQTDGQTQGKLAGLTLQVPAKDGADVVVLHVESIQPR